MWLKIGLLVGFTLAALALAEGVIRVAGLAPGFGTIRFGNYAASDDLVLGWSNAPNAEGINSLGMRGPEPREPRRGARILCLGDSVAYGFGLEPGQTIERRLEETLAQRQLDAEVLNAGVIAYNSKQEGRWLELNGPALAPDHVVVLYCLNDTTELGNEAVPEDLARVANKQGRKEDWARTRGLPKLSPFERALYEHCQLARLIWVRTQPKPDLQIAGNATLVGQGWSKDFSVVEDGFGRVARYCAKAGIHATVAIVPWLEHLDRYPNQAQHDRVAQIARGLGLGVVDLLPAFADHFAKTGHSTAQPNDPVHPDAEGAEVAARALADVLAPIVARRNSGGN